MTTRDRADIEREGTLSDMETLRAEKRELQADNERLGALATIVREQGIELTDLRAEIERLKTANDYAYDPRDGELSKLNREIERLKAQAVTDWIKHGDEIERLKAALQRIDGINDNPACFNPMIDEVLDEVLRRALQP